MVKLSEFSQKSIGGQTWSKMLDEHNTCNYVYSSTQAFVFISHYYILKLSKWWLVQTYPLQSQVVFLNVENLVRKMDLQNCNSDDCFTLLPLLPRI